MGQFVQGRNFGCLIQPSTSSHGQDGGAYCRAAVGGKCMQSKAKLVVYAFAMVGFGLQQHFGTAEKEHPSPPLPSPKVGKVLLFCISQTASKWFLSLH